MGTFDSGVTSNIQSLGTKVCLQDIQAVSCKSWESKHWQNGSGYFIVTTLEFTPRPFFFFFFASLFVDQNKTRSTEIPVYRCDAELEKAIFFFSLTTINSKVHLILNWVYWAFNVLEFVISLLWLPYILISLDITSSHILRTHIVIVTIHSELGMALSLEAKCLQIHQSKQCASAFLGITDGVWRLPLIVLVISCFPFLFLSHAYLLCTVIACHLLV